MTLSIVHTTRYDYPSTAIQSHNEVRLCPMNNREQYCQSFALEITPQPRIFHYDLEQGRVHYFNLYARHHFLEITARATVEVNRENPFTALQLVTPDCHFYDLPHVPQRHFDYLHATKRTPSLPECQEIAAHLWAQAQGRTASFLLQLTYWIHDNFTYQPGATHVHTPLAEMLAKRQGVCQDFAHLMLAICRHQGIPARYVSGYLYNGERAGLLGADATHAWVECLLPYQDETKAHWCGFDPTNRLLAHSHYIKVHHGRDYDDVPPLKGIYRGPAARDLHVYVRVTKK
jgi:transglutaminase-like putative cysteine protease